MLQPIRTHRRLILALASVCALAVLLLGWPGMSPEADAVSRSGHDFTYYSDASHTHAVGYCFVCIGYSGCHGTITPYYVIGPYPCQ